MGTHKMPIIFVVATVLAVTTGAPTTLAQTGTAGESPRRYAECMALARKAPEKAYRSALGWRDRGGGDAARHCVAVALLGLGLYAEAAQRLEELADNAKAKGVGLRGDLLGQAANAWLIAGKPDAAYAAQSAALDLNPNDAELLIDRSISLTSAGKYWEAIDDLNKALELESDRVDALVFRATAYRRLKSLDLADQDVSQALKIDPTQPDGLLERGLVRRGKGDRAGARRDWMKVLDVAPFSAAAEAARRNLERMDLKVE